MEGGPLGTPKSDYVICARPLTEIALNVHSYALTTCRCMAALFREVVFEEADEDNDDNHGNHGINDNPGAMTKWQLMYVRKNPETVIHSAL